MSLRVQLHNIVIYKTVNERLKKHTFYNKLKGLHNVWKLTFTVEQADALYEDSNPIGALCNDCNNVPMLTSLNETIENMQYLKCNSNIYFTVEQNANN
jgi:hypothetical protein